MESLENPIMHATETKTICSTLPCASNGVDVISKKLEDELLYGTTEDMDEDDAQSDDSLRLRLSDDDVDADDMGASLPRNNQANQLEKTEPLDMEFDIHTSNDCLKQHQESSSGIYSIADKDNGFEKKLDFTNDDVLMENNFCDTGEKNAFEHGTNQFLMLSTVKYTYEKPQKLASSFKTFSCEANQSFSVHQSSPDHSYYSIGSNHYCNKYYNQNSHYGQCRGYKFGEFNTYFNSLGSIKKYGPRVYPPSKSILSEKKYITPGSNSQTNVSAIENASHKDNSSSGIENTQHNINNDIKSITTENNSPELGESELSTDKFNTPLNLSEDPSQSHDIQIEPKGIKILDKDDKTITTLYETMETNNCEDNNSIEKKIVTPNVEQLIMPTNVQTKNGDILKNTVVASVDCPQTSVKSNCNQEIKEIQSSISEVMLITPIGNVPNDGTITNNEILAADSQDDCIPTDIEPIIAKTDNLKDGLDKVSNTDTTIDERKDNSISENYPIADCSQNNNDNIADDDEIKSGTKRSLTVSENENTICKKVPCQKLVNKNVDTSALVGNQETEQSSSIEVISTTEECLQVKPIIKHENIAHKSENENEKSNNTDIIKSESLDEKTSIQPIEILDDGENLDKDDDKLEITAVIQSTEISAKCKRRRRKRKINPSGDVINSGQEKENVRQKRETAQKAEEMIRKRFQSNDSDSESDDNASTYVNYNKPNSRARPSSPPSLKRNCLDEPIENNAVKKLKKGIDNSLSKKTETTKSNDNCKTLDQVRKFFWRDGKKSLSQFTQEELEELLVQKVIETITMRDEIGKLREQAKISERNQEATRLKCQQLTKQMKDFEMVLNRFAADRRGGDKTIPPIKINRSVGLQVNFVTDNGIQNLRQLQYNTMKSNATVANGENSSAKPSTESTNNNSNNRKGIKVRSPRRANDVPPVSPTMSTASTPIQSPVPSTPTGVTPAALVVTKAGDNRHIINSPGQVITQQGTVTINGAITTTTRQTKVVNTRNTSSNTSSSSSSNNNNSNKNSSNNNNNSCSNSSNNNNNKSNVTNNNENLIDLTGEEEKSKNVTNLSALSAITTVSNPIPISKAPPRYQRVIQPTPTNMTIAQPAFKLLQTVDKPMPTAIVNNMNAPRFTFVMHGIAGQRQLLIPSNTNSIRPAVTTNNRASFPAITYAGVHTISNGSVRVLPATTTAPAQKQKHPAALPGVTSYPLNAALKLPPPAPSLKISKVANGIVLSWNMRTSDEYAEIASYQLFAYQEVTGMAPSTALWKKVGDVRALPLPMACTLTQFSEGNNYYFAVRAVDTHSRFGLYSHPGNISL